MSEDKVVAPHSLEELKALPAVKSTEASASFANYVNEGLKREDGTYAEGFTPLTAEQAWTLLYVHRLWQSSPERAKEKEALKAAKAEDAEKRKAEREAKAAEKKAEAERKAEEKKAKAAEKAAKEAGDDSDLEGEAAPAAAPKRRRPAPAKAGEAAGTI